MRIVFLFILSFVLAGCGHVETHRQYYDAQKTRAEQHQLMMTEVANAQARMYEQALKYAQANPLVNITQPDGTKIIVNQMMPAPPASSLEHVPTVSAPEMPREAPGEKFAMKLVDGATAVTLGFFATDMIKTGFKEAGDVISTGGDFSYGNMEKPITTTTTTTTETTSTQTQTDMYNPTTITE